MLLSNWDDNSYAFYLLIFDKAIDDTFKEWAMKLKADTLRILVDERGIAIGSGHGNTHDSMIRKIRHSVTGFKRWFPRDYIAYNGKFYNSGNGDVDEEYHHPVPETRPKYWSNDFTLNQWEALHYAVTFGMS